MHKIHFPIVGTIKGLLFFYNKTLQNEMETKMLLSN